ncbi:MAG: nickel insertion protein [Burkholderiales bacterium]
MSAPLLIMAQVDDAGGEVLQDVAERLHAAGARNVQVLASLGKKGRPAHVLMIDVPAQQEDEVAALLAAELGVWGYRVLESRHRHFDICLHSRPVGVQLGEDRFEVEVGCKRIERQGRLLAVKAEHDHLVRLRDQLTSRGHTISLRQLRTLLERELWTAPDAERIELRIER